MSSFIKNSFLFYCCVVSSYSLALTIKRVILATNDNPEYIQFWPYVARAWKQLIGVRPTLALIGDHTVKVDETLGDVLRFEPIHGVPTSLQAQVIRLLLPAYFPDDGCIISDIDQLPLKRSYFIDLVKKVPNHHFVVYNNRCYGPNFPRFPMCYIAAKGRVFKEVFKIGSVRDIPALIQQWAKLGFGFHTDEFILYRHLLTWKGYKKRCTKLNDTLGARDRRRIRDNRHANTPSLKYNPDLVKQGFYVDSFLPRPYNAHKKELHKLAALAGIKLKK
jgi:hypothetical protein